jgi:hypothetical protein
VIFGRSRTQIRLRPIFFAFGLWREAGTTHCASRFVGNSPNPLQKEERMFSRTGYTRAIAADVGEIERRVRALEGRLERMAGRTSAGASLAADRIGDAVAAALSGMADRFRAIATPEDAARIRRQAARLGDVALRRVSRETEHHPFVMLAAAVGVGVLVGLACARH